MAFIRYKMVKGRKYYYLVRNYREKGKHRQQVLCYLGQHKSLDEAIDYEKDMVSGLLRSEAAHAQEAASTKAYLFEFYGDRVTDKRPSLNDAYSEWDTFCKERYASFYEYRRGFLYIESFYPKRPFIDPESTKRNWPWWDTTRQRHEEALLESIVDYYNEKEREMESSELADKHQAQLDKYLALKSAYG
jgi:hypothetical protein